MIFDSLALSTHDFADSYPNEPQTNKITDREGLRLISEIGIAAITLGKGERAVPIFEMLSEQQPDNAAGPLLLALSELGQGKINSAISRLQTAIRQRTRCRREAKAVLCLLLKQAGRASEAQVLKIELLRGPDCGAKRMINTMWG